LGLGRPGGFFFFLFGGGRGGGWAASERREEKGTKRTRASRDAASQLLLRINLSVPLLPRPRPHFQRVIMPHRVQCGPARSTERHFKASKAPQLRAKTQKASAPRESASRARPAASRNRARSCCRPAPSRAQTWRPGPGATSSRPEVPCCQSRWGRREGQGPRPSPRGIGDEMQKGRRKTKQADETSRPTTMMNSSRRRAAAPRRRA